MTRLLLNADDLLREGAPGGPPRDRATPGTRRLLELLAMIVVFGLVYGAVMGSFGGVFGQRFLQVAYSAVKVPILLMATFLLSLPSFFVFNTLLGMRADFGQAIRALLAAQAGLTIVLASLAPFTALWYASSDHYRRAILFNALMFAIASLVAQVLLRRAYRPLIAKDRKHRILLRLWLVIYAFVGIQMGWLLRPFIGNPSGKTQFFREDTWGNAYLLVFEMIREAMR